MPQNVSRWRVFRLALPVFFVVTLLFPLSTALSRVVWEVNVSKGLRAIMQDFEKEHRIFSKQQLISHEFVALQVTLVGTPGAEEELTQSLAQKVRAISGIEPAISVEILPSTEFMNQSLKQTTDRVSNELEQVRLKAMAPPVTPEEVIKKAEPGLLMGQLLQQLSAPVKYLSENDKSGDWVDWAVTVQPGGHAQLRLRRIADEPLSSDALSLMAAHLKKETGIDFTLEQKRFIRTLFETENPTMTAAKKKAILAELDELIDLGQVCVEVVLCSPENAKSSYQKIAWTKFNHSLLALVNEKFPEARTRKQTDSTIWKVQFYVSHETAKSAVEKPKSPPVVAPKPDEKSAAEKKTEPAKEDKANAPQEPEAKST